MQCWNIRELIFDKKKRSNLSGGIINYYLECKKMLSNLNSTEFDYFVAGYMLGTNSNIRQELMQRIKLDEKIRNKY